jgi:DNA-binding NarL/FixJ family response regulator
MNTGACPGPLLLSRVQPDVTSDGATELTDFSSTSDSQAEAGSEPISRCEPRIRVCVAADNRLLREALAGILAKRGRVDVIVLASPMAPDVGALVSHEVQVLLLVSQGNIEEDLRTIQRVHGAAPAVQILLIGSTNEDGEFLQCVRAGISGYLWRDASADDVLEGIRAVRAGEAVCPGALCTVLFRYFERETPELPCASPRQRLGLTRREQQIVPLIAKGLTNKEIANHFCLSEQTVKNHLYRMKHKIGAEDRLSIVQRFRTQGFLLTNH